MQTDISPVYPQPFFDLQLVFAQKIADLSRQPFAQALLHYTALYRIFGLDWSLDPTNAIWQAYIQDLQHASDKGALTHQFYLHRYLVIPKFTDEEHWGCFTYEYRPPLRAIHLHFSDQDTSSYGPLSHHRIDARKSELRAMFQYIQAHHPAVALVQGGSWLYNWESYARLFPQAFGLSAKKVETPHLTGRNTWGQFLRRGWTIHQTSMSLFLQRVSQLTQLEDYPQCFPYPVLQTEAPIHLFYEFYDL